MFSASASFEPRRFVLFTRVVPDDREHTRRAYATLEVACSEVYGRTEGRGSERVRAIHSVEPFSQFSRLIPKYGHGLPRWCVCVSAIERVQRGLVSEDCSRMNRRFCSTGPGSSNEEMCEVVCPDQGVDVCVRRRKVTSREASPRTRLHQRERERKRRQRATCQYEMRTSGKGIKLRTEIEPLIVAWHRHGGKKKARSASN